MNYPRLPLAQLPTPIEPLLRLSKELNGPRIFVKRDDLTGLALGGNKVRKLEFVVAEALANGAKTLVTVGSIQSNHCRQTAAVAAKLGLRCILVLSGQEPAQNSGNLFLDHLLGAEIVWTTREERENVLQKTFQESWQRGERPYLIPLGASNPVGTLGYAAAMEELSTVEPQFDWIIVASSSGGTQAGMVLGASLTGWHGKILGISIDHPVEELRETVSFLANEAADRLREKCVFKPDQILVNSDFLGAGYAVAGEPEVETIRLFAKLEGLILDPVYTARAAAGMIALIHKGFFQPNEKILFWHTGGTPALFAEPYQSLMQ
jgi:D-cysteine desulfhydrase family pyridoxal phosphate-dependent enzyme